MCWTRETGVIPAALAGLLLGMKAPGAQMIASVTFIAILMTILIQAPTTEWLGKASDFCNQLRANHPLSTNLLFFFFFLFYYADRSEDVSARTPPSNHLAAIDRFFRKLDRLLGDCALSR